MTEQERIEMTKWLDSPIGVASIALKMIQSHCGRIYIQTPETKGFPANRFSGRLSGYMFALVHDRVTDKEQLHITIENIVPYATKDELNALELLKQKIKEQSEQEIPPFDDGYVGLCEGMAIYINKEDVSLLYSEVDIDLNKYCDDEGIPSYAYHKAYLKAGLQLAKCDKSREEVIQILMNDGIAEKGASLIVERMFEEVKKQRKKDAIKSIVVGSIILIIGLLITCITYNNAANNGGGRFILAWGALGGGAFYSLYGVVNFIKALLYKG